MSRKYLALFFVSILVTTIVYGITDNISSMLHKLEFKRSNLVYYMNSNKETLEKDVARQKTEREGDIISKIFSPAPLASEKKEQLKSEIQKQQEALKPIDKELANLSQQKKTYQTVLYLLSLVSAIIGLIFMKKSPAIWNPKVFKVFVLLCNASLVIIPAMLAITETTHQYVTTGGKTTLLLAVILCGVINMVLAMQGISNKDLSVYLLATVNVLLALCGIWLAYAVYPSVVKGYSQKQFVSGIVVCMISITNGLWSYVNRLAQKKSS